MRSATAWPWQEISVATDENWDARIRCQYQVDPDQWVADLPTGFPAAGLQLKFLCNGVWQHPVGAEGNLRITPDRYHEVVHFEDVRFPGTEGGEWPKPALQFFRPDRRDDEWDVIIVGSGMGGGVLAHALTTHPHAVRKRILVLEAGPYLMPTHVGNLPRKHDLSLNQADKSIWDMYWDFRVQDYRPLDDPDGQIDISTGINLGGRSIFWGATAPRMSSEELSRWPAPVQALGPFYDRAEALLRVDAAPDSDYQKAVLGVLNAVLPGLAHAPTPMAVQYRAQPASAVPTGIFSTAALLFEDVLQHDDRRGGLQVHLNERVIGLTTEDRAGADGRRRVVTVHSRDTVQLPDHPDPDHTHAYPLAADGQVILAAGSVNSAALVQRSGLAAGPLAGQGLSDHPVFYVGFRIRPDQRFSPVSGTFVTGGVPQSSKTLSRRSGVGLHGGRGYNVLLELGANFNQSRFGSDAEFRRVLQDEADPRGSWCEAVFLLDADLVPGNAVSDGSGIQIRMAPCDVPESDQNELRDVAKALIVALDGTPEPNGEVTLHRSLLGAVGHEVGSLRMGVGLDNCVVDTDLVMHGHTNLRVCDLSVFPTSPASNPSLTLAALALRLSDQLTAAW